MGLSAATVWEVRQGGSDNNGGGFRTGASGTDRSLQDAAHATLTTASTVHTTTTQINVAVGDFTVSAADVGNLLQVTGGTATVGFYDITAVDVPNNRWTVDRAVGTAGQTVAGAMGGALATPGGQKGAVVGGNKVALKYNATPITLTSATPNVAGGPLHVPASQNLVAVFGYDATRTINNTDANRPTIKAGANATTFSGVNSSARGNIFRNLIFDANAKTGCIGYNDGSVDRNYIENVKAVGLATGFSMAGATVAFKCESTGHTTAGFSGGGWAIGCTAHDGTALGFTAVHCFDCLSYNNAGASTDGFVASAFGSQYQNCTAYNNGRHGFDLSTTAGRFTHSYNSLAYGNGGFGFNCGTETILANHAAGSNTSGNVTGTPIELTTLVSLSADPFTSVAGADFSLNTTAGGGAACRAAGHPGVFPAGTTTGYVDIGAVQHQDPAGGGGGGLKIIGTGGLVG